jgi:leucokinin receptor
MATENLTQPEDPCDEHAYYYEDYTQIPAVHFTFVTCYVIVTTVSLFGNFFVIWTVWKHKHMRTGTNIYIVNLAVSDFLVALFVMPLKLLEYTAPCSWKVFNRDALCSFVYFTFPVFVFASVFTLVAISIDR